ncbi:hypothetical protein PC114_g21241 [Phytophthora cactorum]|nr:hypothetical protein PC114_g21241 [Phytophthora cactorum]KAG3047668.1 hypothetical protein PC121_g19929 [Phytophthora cactorum]KAG4043768.1 hypothetical protein PC123_g20775 [Phytophthora cactorum]
MSLSEKAFGESAPPQTDAEKRGLHDHSGSIVIIKRLLRLVARSREQDVQSDTPTEHLSRLAKRHDLTVASHKPLALANAPLVEAERELYHNTKPANLTESVTDNGLWAPINAAAIRKAFKLSALYMHQRSFPGVST